MTGITSAMSSATSGLMAQSKALGSISSNIANSSTTGFKATTTDFASYINKSSTIDEQTGGVLATNNRNISAQGNIQASATTTNMAINGEGFFAVSDDTDHGEVAYSRNGSFSTDADGFLRNSENYYLYGWKLDDSGKVASSNNSSVDSLEAINLSDIKGTPKATSKVSIAANLPSDADVGASFTSDIELFDSLGNSSSVQLTWTKTAVNTWSVDGANPTKSSDSTTSTGTIGGFPITVTFNSDGSLASTSGNSFMVGGWTTGASNSTVTLNLGTANGSDGLTQHTSGETTPSIDVESTTQDGYKPGTLTGTKIDSDGTVRATFDNGETRAIYRIPVVTFANPNGLESVTGSIFKQTYDSGQYQLRTAGDGKAGSVKSSALEDSTVDIADEFTRMIVAQQAYSAASKVITTSDDMINTVIGMKR
ncbi:flagellar hook protein FlgE [Azospirillum canadense]|uniref:flagellar hook protein FlgE n=1 Tax=Azospirillum canadense TaxID=403962 RepID=UPI002226F3F9|nr:flagellar hook protein FlgE [Azospirillum canadense]MCW2239742.1 flagellar hook protein FlgE [Azospirillum canadense]